MELLEHLMGLRVVSPHCLTQFFYSATKAVFLELSLVETLEYFVFKATAAIILYICLMQFFVLQMKEISAVSYILSVAGPIRIFMFNPALHPFALQFSGGVEVI